ncbi:ATP-binding protein [Actinacidiphila yeochonensis]|uniref:ATP-binding protein n=1 Tax=Actinacidiphila yeochonensis TaxID=89050 RepID=UPI000569A1C3|nr:ATP-binding protein [Actinacidiphila yeochonensis]
MKSDISTGQGGSSALQFTRLLAPTPRGAHEARLLTVRTLGAWGWPSASPVSESAALVVSELAANAARHGRVRGRKFRLALTAGGEGTLRIEVSDARGERLPQPGRADSGGIAESGRGLLLVEALSAAWGTTPYPPSGKTVWACLPLT